MIQFMDSHIHLQDYNANNTTEIIQAAEACGVDKFIAVSSTEGQWADVLKLAQSYPHQIIPALGIHPWYIGQICDGWEKRLENLLLQNPQALVGECGLDRIKNPEFAPQREIFSIQLELARKYQRSLLIHAVKAAEWLEDFWKFLPERSVFHAFGGRMDMLKKLLNHGGYAAFGFAIFKNRDAQQILRYVPADRILFETDAPYMSPVKGQPNLPQYLPEIAAEIAKIRGEDLETLAAQVYQNSLKIAGLIK